MFVLRVFGIISLSVAIAQVVSHCSWWLLNCTDFMFNSNLFFFSSFISRSGTTRSLLCVYWTFYQDEKEHDPNPTQPAQTLHTHKKSSRISKRTVTVKLCTLVPAFNLLPWVAHNYTPITVLSVRPCPSVRICAEMTRTLSTARVCCSQANISIR